MSASPALLVQSRPHARLLNGLVLAPALHVRQSADHRIVATSELSDSDSAEYAARRTFDNVKALLRRADDLVLDSYSVGHRPVPHDGLPIIGRLRSCANLYVAVTHSGITLAPAIGWFAAEEILADRRDLLLAPFAPSRLGCVRAGIPPGGAS